MNKQQLASYKQTRWKRFSQTIIKENDYCCSRCGRKEAEGTTLQVHHKYYEQSKSPWEYAPKAFEVLCKACHAKEHGHIMPTDGWEYIDCEDMGEPCVDCEYPNCTYDGQLRYVHTVYHPKWGYLNVGCEHANKLTATLQASEKERDAKQKTKDFDKFLQADKWIHFANRYIREYFEFLIIIKYTANDYELSIYNIPIGNNHTSLLKAQIEAFNTCYNYSSKAFCEQHNLPYPDSEHKKPRSKINPVIYRDHLSFAYNHRKGKLMHIDSVEPDILCKCFCPACKEPLYADNTSEDSQRHQFRHINKQSCNGAFEQMYRQLALQLIEENKQITLPSYSNPEVELSIPSEVIQDISIKKSEIYDAIIEYRINDTDKQLGIVINLTNTINEERLQKIKQKNLSTIEIKLSKYTEKIKLKELRKLLLNIQDFASWLMHPQYEQQEKLLFEAKNAYVNKLHNLIPLTINSCIKGDNQIGQIAERYLSCEEFPATATSLFHQELKKTVQRIIQKPTEEDCTHTDNCLKILEWYYHYDKDTLYDILQQCNFVEELAKQQYNHTKKRLEFMRTVFKYYFSKEPFLDSDYAKNKYHSIRDDIQKKFFKYSPFFNKYDPLSSQKKYGMELCFLLFLYYGVTRLGWNNYKKKKMYEQLHNADNLPIFAAVGSLWFGHVFNIFQTNDFQEFIQTIVSQYPKAGPWVLTYIENTKKYKEKYSNSDSILKLKTLQKNSESCWLAAVLYSAFNYTFEKPILP